MKQLPTSLILAVARYYFERDRVRKYNARNAMRDMAYLVGCPAEGFTFPAPPAPTFNKDAALARINTITNKLNMAWEASAGTFWFTKCTKSGHSHIVFKVNENNYLDGGERKVNKVTTLKDAL